MCIRDSLTGVAVRIPGERETWRIFHHFQWMCRPSFHGTEALQLWPVYLSLIHILGSFDVPGREGISVEAEWKAVKGSRYYETPVLYKENGFKEKKTAEELIRFLSAPPMEGTLVSMEKKRETKNAPLLYNLAELQNDCSKMFKISPDAVSYTHLATFPPGKNSSTTTPMRRRSTPKGQSRTA